MADVITYLSPNGDNRTHGPGPATVLRVATLEGVATLRRDGQGKPWALAERSLEERHVGSLVYEPQSGKLFAGAHADGGLWVSDDGAGKSWRPLTKGLDRPHIYSLNARNLDGKVTLWLGTSPAGLYRSDDLGESWREIKSIHDVPDTDKWTFPPPPHIPHVKATVFHPHEPKTVYVLVEQGAFLKSVDDGETWRELSAYSDPDEIAYRDVHRLLIDPDNADRMFLATGEGLYRSFDGGESWDHLMKRGDRIGYPDFLYFDPRDHHVIYAGGSHKNPGAWFADGFASSGIMKSTDGGDSWTELKNGLPEKVVGAYEGMSQHVWDGGMMLTVGSATGQLYTTENGGESWDCIAENVTPVSKDDHHMPFMTKEERKATAERLARAHA